MFHSIQGISDKLGIVSALVSIFQNWQALLLYDVHIYPYKHLTTVNLTPLIVTRLILTNVSATKIIKATLFNK